MAYRTTKIYKKDETIVLAFDIGTTHSTNTSSVVTSDVYELTQAPCHSLMLILESAQTYDQSVSVYNPTGSNAQNSLNPQIPTIVAYQGGEAKLFAAEAREHLDSDEYQIARWFKLHLHPESMKSSHRSAGRDELEIPSPPPGVSLPQVYADFIQYLYKGTKDFFVNNTPNGQRIWSRLEGTMPMIFCTPNGWDISEHDFLTQAAIRAGIVDPSKAAERLWFITEGEASVHYSLAHTQTAEWLKGETIFAVTDADGSTVDSTLYRCRGKRPLVLEEVCASACVQAGGVYVDRAIEGLLKQRLADTNYRDTETISLMTQQFEQKTKRTFDGSQLSNVIQFGTPRDNDKEHNIAKGKLTLNRDEVGAAYTGVISNITRSCRELLGNRDV
ncbi:hypothetical protein FRC17_001476 [Serendipita sp. 399]|nr:hypothetical protein FRC17_001476 [Serendipita sp. 399]